MMRAVVVVALSMLCFVVVACSDDGGSSKNQQGAAGFAVAEFFRQEKDGGVLPEGPEVAAIGGGTPKPLAIVGSEAERYCVEFRYRPLSDIEVSNTRVYEAKLVDGAWEIAPIQTEDGTCESVT
jgi:hypothetical protein